MKRVYYQSRYQVFYEPCRVSITHFMFFHFLVFSEDIQIKLGYSDGKCQLSNDQASVLIALPLGKQTCEQLGTPFKIKQCDPSFLVQTCERHQSMDNYKSLHLTSPHIGKATNCEYKLVQQEYKIKMKEAVAYFSLNEQFKINDMDKNNPFHHVVTTCHQNTLYQYFCDDSNLNNALCFPSTKLLTPENLFCMSSEPCEGLEWTPKHLINVQGAEFNLFDNVMMKERRQPKDEL